MNSDTNPDGFRGKHLGKINYFLGMAIDPQGDLATIGLARGANRIGGVVFGFDSVPMRHAR